MAKVIGPLMSVGASGQFAKSMVFQKNGTVREYVVPANPQTVAQMAVRDRLASVQSVLKMLITTPRTELRAGFGPRWNSMIVQELTANDGAVVTAYDAEYAAFSAGEKTAWDSFRAGATDGKWLYACASAVYDMALRLGVTITLDQPAHDNANDVVSTWVG